MIPTPQPTSPIPKSWQEQDMLDPHSPPSSPPRRRRAFTLVELLVVIGIIAVLIAILMPALRRARNQAQKVDCMSRIRQIILATHMYTQVNKGWLPGPHGQTDPPGPQTISVETGWLWTGNFLKNKEVWLCPVDPRPEADRQYSFTYNGRMFCYPGHEDDVAPDTGNGGLIPDPHFRRITSFHYPDQCLVYGEENVTGSKVGQYMINDCYFIYDDVTDDRHMGKSVAAYLDGHAGDIPPKLNLFRSNQWGYCH
jgi:prepilin-type N-terminal cleavage/methylation domain-containing protein/prepilin-type processing-associated H-X9-DG protein